MAIEKVFRIHSIWIRIEVFFFNSKVDCLRHCLFILAQAFLK